MKDYVPSYPNPDDDDRPEWEKKLRPLFSAAEDKDGEGARPSSLIPACNMPDPGLGYELMLMRELKIINEQTVRELGPLPKGGLPVQQKRKPTRPYTDFLGRPVPDVLPIIEENDEMKLSQIVGSLALSAVLTTEDCAASTMLREGQLVRDIAASETANEAVTGDQRNPGYRASFTQCMGVSDGVTVNMMNCIGEELDYQDKRLNIAYKRLRQTLASADWEPLRSAQRKWLAGRDEGCEAGDGMKGGTIEMLMLAECELRKTASRADELEALLKQQNH